VVGGEEEEEEYPEILLEETIKMKVNKTINSRDFLRMILCY